MLRKVIKKSNLKRHLIGFADSEGVPHRNHKNNLWNVSIIFKFIVDEEFVNVNDIFHTTHFACQKNIGSDYNDSVRTYFNHLEMLKARYETDSIYLCFWNAPHDVAVLKKCGIDNYKYIDLLKWAQHTEFSEKPKNYTINEMFKTFKGKGELNSLHTGLGDTVRMIKIYEHIQNQNGWTDAELLKSFFNYEYISKTVSGKKVRFKYEKKTCDRSTPPNEKKQEQLESVTKRFSKMSIDRNEIRNHKLAESINDAIKRV